MGEKNSGRRRIQTPKKCMVTKYRLIIKGQNKVFDSQGEAKQAAIKVLESGHVYFLSLEQINEEGC